MKSLYREVPLVLALAMTGACGGRQGPKNPDSSTNDTDSNLTPRTTSIGNFDESSLPKNLAEGLAIWRKQRVDINGISKGACANCHSADGLELALWDFADDDVRRRAKIDGVNEEDSEKLVTYFAALRQKYGIQNLKNRLEDRPFQPQGRPFPGDTVAERDYAFAVNSLRELAPTLYDSNIETVAQAIQAKEELKRSNLMRVKIGIPLPRISEDCFHGEEHCSANDWIADLPRLPKPEFETEWYSLNDRYIADPTPANLREVLNAADTMTTSWRNPGETKAGPAANLGTYKFRSMQILQHFLRRQQLGLSDPTQEDHPLAPIVGKGQPRPNAPFLVGDFGFNKDSAPWFQPESMPAFVRSSLGETAERPFTAADVENQKLQLAMPWWYAGFMLDPSLNSGTKAEYFLGAIGRDRTGGYPFHSFYAIGKRGTFGVGRKTDAANAEAYNVALPGTAFKNVGDNDLSRLFVTVEARQTYRRLETNWTVMWLLLAKEQLEKSGLASFRQHDDIALNLCAATGPVSLRQWVATASGFDGQRAEFLFSLYNSINALANCGLNPLPSSYAAGTGSGLTLEWFNGPGDEFNGKTSILVKSEKLATRVESIVDFPGREDGAGYFAQWARSVGVKVVEGENTAYSSRGTGYIQAPVTGDYQFFLNDRGGGFGKLLVDGKEVYSKFRYNKNAPLKVTISLQANQRYPINFERHGYAAGGIQLEWASDSGKLPRQKIPTSQLYPN